jgi:DNA-binding CsgD family transcriptional regulator
VLVHARSRLPADDRPAPRALPDRLAQLTRNEYAVDDVNKFAELARRRRPAAMLSDATRGRPERSARYATIMRPADFAHELRAAFVAGGAAWGAASIVRHQGRPDFSGREAGVLAGLSRSVAEGIRRSLLVEAASTDDDAATPGLLLVGRRGDVELVTPAARRYLTELGFEPEGPLPLVVRAVTAAARHSARSQSTAPRPTRAHTRAPEGGWITVHAAVPEGATGPVAVILTRSRPAETAAIRLRVHGLTHREQHVLRLVALGLSTAAIAERLVVSPHTVQDHLRNIFEKTGTRTRRERVAHLFFTDYQAELTTAPLDSS